MTLVQLKHLIELASRGSFSQSASKLFITQPALSRSIKALEDELGQSLFDRIGRKNKLTHFGQHFVQRARGLVDEANELRQTSAQFQKGDIGQFRVGMGSGPGRHADDALADVDGDPAPAGAHRYFTRQHHAAGAGPAGPRAGCIDSG